MSQRAPSRFRSCAIGIAWVAMLLPGAIADDSRAAANLARGDAALRSGDLDSAVAAFRAASEADPQSTDALMKLGMTLSRRREYDGAEDAYRRLLALDPGNSRAWNNLANVFLRQDRYEEAADHYAKALEVEPDYLLALFHHAWILRQLNRIDEAIPEFERCLELTPGSDRDRVKQLDCRFFLGTLRFRKLDYQASATLMEQVLGVHPGHIEARYYLGMAYRGLGRMDEARQQLELHRQALDLKRRDTPIEKPDPDDP